MATPTAVQNSGVVNGTGTSLADPTGYTVTAGNCLMCMVTLASHTRTVTVSDNQGNTWVRISGDSDATNACQAEVWRAFGCAGAATIVTVSISGASTTITFAVEEFTAADTADTGDTFENTVSAGTVYSAAVAGITTSTDVAVCFCNRLKFAATTTTFATGFTQIGSGSQSYLFGYQASAGSLSGERAPVVIGTNRAANGAIGSVKAAAGATGVGGRIVGSSFGGRIQGLGA